MLKVSYCFIFAILVEAINLNSNHNYIQHKLCMRKNTENEGHIRRM